jgi:hypothetical protein
MPMNQFLLDHQFAAMKVDGSGSNDERKEAAAVLESRAKRLANWRKASGFSEMSWPHSERSSPRGEG